jgi:hypothetical protein
VTRRKPFPRALIHKYSRVDRFLDRLLIAMGVLAFGFVVVVLVANAI